jgi:DNA-binding NarL/FixJ family response regulator
MTKILIADDHEVVRHGLRDILAKEFADAQIGESCDSRETLDLIQQEPWDLILLDINMPGRSGLDVLRDAKSLCPKVPVLVLSAYPEEEFALRALKLGASAYLNKQIASAEMVVAIRKILSGGKYLTSSLAQKLADSLGEDLQKEPHESLSLRELEVLRMIASGHSTKEIAEQLALGEATIATYRARISKKMGLFTNVELARYALQRKLVE